MKSIKTVLTVVMGLVVIIPIGRILVRTDAALIPRLLRSVPRKETSGNPESTHVPKLLPGATCNQAKQLLGVPSEEDTYILFWSKPAFEASAAKNSECTLTSIRFRARPGHRVLTADGITLGRTTVAEAEQLLRSRLGTDAEIVDAPEGNWEALIALAPKGDFSYRGTSGFSYKGTYFAFLSDHQARLLSHDPVFDDFRGLPITEHDIELVAPKDDARK
jgi:hypothetical protein